MPGHLFQKVGPLCYVFKEVVSRTHFCCVGAEGFGNATLVVWTGHWIGLARKLVPGQRQGVLPPGSGMEAQGLCFHCAGSTLMYAKGCGTSSSRGAGAGVGGLSGPVCPSALPALLPVGRTPVPDPAQNGLDESDMVPAHRAGGGGGKKTPGTTALSDQS